MSLVLTATSVLVLDRTAAAASPSGPVDVLSAGSLQDLLQQQVATAVQKATGDTLNDTSMGSDALANGIKGGTLQGDVYISASPAVNRELEGEANGNWVSWYAEFGSSPLVLGYNPSSRFTQALKTKPWYDVIDQPGFLSRPYRPRDRLCVPNTHPIRSRHEPVLVNQSPENFATS